MKILTQDAKLDNMNRIEYEKPALEEVMFNDFEIVQGAVPSTPIDDNVGDQDTEF